MYDVTTVNGVIYGISKVLLPPNMDLSSGFRIGGGVFATTMVVVVLLSNTIL